MTENIAGIRALVEQQPTVGQSVQMLLQGALARIEQAIEADDVDAALALIGRFRVNLPGLVAAVLANTPSAGEPVPEPAPAANDGEAP